MIPKLIGNTMIIDDREKLFLFKTFKISVLKLTENNMPNKYEYPIK